MIGLLAAGSVILLLLSIVVTPFVVSRLPVDYLIAQQSVSRAHPALRLIIDALRTLIGGALIALGLAMMIIPGPGTITLIIGLSLAKFPGKQRLLCYVSSRDLVFNSLNWMRKRHNKPPFLHPLHAR